MGSLVFVKFTIHTIGPIYTFYNKRTKKEFDEMMTISKRKII